MSEVPLISPRNGSFQSNHGRVVCCAVVAVFVLIANVVAASRQVLVVTHDGDKIRLSFDPTRISRARLRALVRFSPWDHSFPPSLSFCVSNDPRYRPCGTQELGSESFLYNAERRLRSEAPKDGELVTGHRCETEAIARYVSRAFAQDHLRTGWSAP